MATPETSSQRLGLVGDQHGPTADVAAPGGEQTAKQAAAFAALVANCPQSAVEGTLDQMNTEQLHSLAIALAAQVNASVDANENANGEVADVGPDGVCAIAIASAAQFFGTNRAAILSADRHRAVTDARAVAMTAARRGGLTLTAIGTAFGKDHTSVMYAQNKVVNNPRLNAVCTHIVNQLDAHFAEPISLPEAGGEPAAAAGRSRTLQLTALDQARNDTARPDEDDDNHRRAVSAALVR
ncbi:MAG: helix-turn-helix domain-containing protein [Nocardioides sp.]|uniref:helix-turn-helix domain-containing protein n=1 Tax=Nocardioides sp. TaxID=35761 RepID=UPI0032653CAF